MQRKHQLRVTAGTALRLSRFPGGHVLSFILVFAFLGGVYALRNSFASTVPTITVSPPGLGATACGTRFSSQESYSGLAEQPPPGGGYPTLYQRIDSSNLDLWRVQGDDGFDNPSTSLIEPENYFNSGNNNTVYAWSFATLDESLSTGPTGAPRELTMSKVPDALYTGTAPLGGNGSYGALADQTYNQLAQYMANLVRYYRTGILVSDSGSNVTYTATSLTDTSQNFSAYGSGYAVTATVLDTHGVPDWVTGNITGVTNGGHTITIDSWSTANSYNYNPVSNSTPAAGAAYNLASTTPPITSPINATPWPRPPSVGNVQYFELFNEPDLSAYGYSRNSPPLLPPTPTLTGTNVSGGNLTPGSTYSYRITAVNVGTQESLPGTEVSITLPSNDNAVKLSWAATSNYGLSPFAYRIYGRSGGSEQAMVVVGRDASTGLQWTDSGNVGPSGSMPTSDNTPNDDIWRAHEYTRMWNVVAPAMKAVDPTIKLTGPTISNAGSLANLDTVTTAVTTGPNDTSWQSYADYIPTLLASANPKPDAITFHAYGDYQGSASTDAEQWAGMQNEISGFLSTDAPNLGSIPVFVDETNINAGYFGDPPSNDLRGETQMGAAWLADSYAEWCRQAPQIAELFQFEDLNGDVSWGMMSDASYAGSTTCIPQPDCANVRASQPNLEYWLMKTLNGWFPPGSTVAPVSGIPSGFNAFAVKPPGSSKVVVIIINTQINTAKDVGGGAAGSTTSGEGVPGSVQLQFTGATVTDTQEITVDQNTDMLNGPTTSDLGATSLVSLNMPGYGVAMVSFNTGAADSTPPSVPTNLSVSSVTSNSVSLSWSASTDNSGGSGVAGYKLYRGGSLVANVTAGAGTAYTDSSLAPGTTYSYTVSAYDYAGNESAQSSAVNATTSSAVTVPGDCNGDGHVTIIDLSILLSHYNQAYTACDFNSDGTVNIFDLSILLSNYGK